MNRLTFDPPDAVWPSDARPPITRAPYPQELHIDWTDYCNAKCFFCYRATIEQKVNGMGGFVPFQKLKRLERVLRSVKYFLISSGIGEPLLHPELEEILRWLYEINPKIVLRTITNGTTLAASKAAWFAGHIDWFSVSLNAANGEAHMRDMFPHLEKRSIDVEKRWELHLCHIAEFISALPPEDRPRIRFQMVTHRDNVMDMAGFVRVVHRIGGSRAVFSNIAAHPDTVDKSLYWLKDTYNDALEEACALGARLGVRVDANRFYTGIKPVLDLDKICRDPIDVAYISPAALRFYPGKVTPTVDPEWLPRKAVAEAQIGVRNNAQKNIGFPCCQWAEAPLAIDVYSDNDGFDRYWSHEILTQLRRKRNSQSCRVCGMSRVFDEFSFHLSPHMKRSLIEQGKLSEIESTNDYPDAALVRTCVQNRLDLPSVRRTLLALDLDVAMARQIETLGLEALSTLEEACWEAFKIADAPTTGTIEFGGRFLGIGWGPPIYEPQNRLSARWIGAAQMASVFMRVEPGISRAIEFIVHSCDPPELQVQLQLQVNGHAIETLASCDQAGRTVLSGIVPSELTELYDGRLWVRIGCVIAGENPPVGEVSLTRFEILEPREALRVIEQFITAKNDALRGLERRIIALEQRNMKKDESIEQQRLRLVELQAQLRGVYASRSWRVTAPVRALATWVRQSPRPSRNDRWWRHLQAIASRDQFQQLGAVQLSIIAIALVAILFACWVVFMLKNIGA